jgi:hypothetical protein
MAQCVWAYQQYRVLHYQTGLVECADDVAAALIGMNRAQDPRIGGTSLILIGSPAPVTLPEFPLPAPHTLEDFLTPAELAARQEYGTKEMTVKRTRK